MIDGVNGEEVLARLQKGPEVKDAGILDFVAGANLTAIDKEGKAVVTDHNGGGVRWKNGGGDGFAKINVAGPVFIGGVRVVPNPVDGDGQRELFLLGLAGRDFRHWGPIANA